MMRAWGLHRLLIGGAAAGAGLWASLLLAPDLLPRLAASEPAAALRDRLGQLTDPAPRALAASPADETLRQVLPMGVYWPGEYLHTDPANPRRIDWPRVDRALDDLASRHVTAIWLTHRTAAQTAAFARRAQRRGIAVVASIAELAGEVPQVRRGNHPLLIRETLATWGDAPRPLAWGLGDEPRTAYMNEMAAYVAAWRRLAPGEPLTTVVMHRDLKAAAAVGFDALAMDVYPFFSPGNPNAYAGSHRRAWIGNTDRLQRAVTVPWMMGQAYQEPWGPFRVSPQGTIVYLPGSAPHWQMPTPAQVRWQTFSAVARGAKGMFYFAYRLAPSPKLRKMPAATLPARVSSTTDSGSPMGLVHLDGRPTPQLQAMGEAFGWIRRQRATLAPLRLAPAAEQPLVPDPFARGHVASLLVHPSTGQRYLMVVSYHTPASGLVDVPVLLGSPVQGLRRLDGNGNPLLTRVPRGQRTSISLPPGSAALFAVSSGR
ncbi:MAG: hypothetical protein VKN13_05880 [Cyanobacteriota bacterium]|nr:hypothetical protein [Cyanobacteriota bacterium]